MRELTLKEALCVLNNKGFNASDVLAKPLSWLMDLLDCQYKLAMNIRNYCSEEV